MSEAQDIAAVRRLILDDILACVNIRTFVDSIANQVNNHELWFIKEILGLSMKASRDDCKVLLPWEQDPCRYHVHPGKPEGYYCTSAKYFSLS